MMQPLLTFVKGAKYHRHLCRNGEMSAQLEQKIGDVTKKRLGSWCGGRGGGVVTEISK